MDWAIEDLESDLNFQKAFVKEAKMKERKI